MKKQLQLLTLIVSVLMISSLAITASAFTPDDIATMETQKSAPNPSEIQRDMTDGSYVSVTSGQTYHYTLSSSGSGRYDEFYISTSGASELAVTMVMDDSNSQYPMESSDDFDLYYKFGARITDCSSSTCSGYDQVSWASGNADEEITLSNPSDGTHHFRVQRYGGAGTEKFFFTATETGGGSGDTTAPSVSVSSPSNGATVSGTTSVTASASDSGSGMEKVEFRIDGALKATDTTSPYSFSWDTTTSSDGSHTVLVRAFDNAGNTADSSISVTVDNSATGGNELSSGVPVTGSLTSSSDSDDYTIEVNQDATSIRVQLDSGSSDFDFFAATYPNPTHSNNVFEGWTYGGEDETYANPSAGTWYIVVDQYSGTGSYTLTVTVEYETTPPPPSGDCGESPRVTGSTPFWNDAIDVEKAHAANCYGGDTVVVVLDTGLGAGYSSLFPSGSILSQYSRSYTQELGYDNVDWDEDTEGHGSSVTGTILGYNVPSSWGMTNDYVQGVAPNAYVVMLRVVYWVGGSVTYDSMINNWASAVDYATSLANNQLSAYNMVVSMSLGYDDSQGSSSANNNLASSISNARSNGVAVSVSAGNDGPGSSTTGNPANFADSTSVAAAGWNGLTGSYGVAGITTDIAEDDFSGLQIADFSSRGKVEITGMGWQLVLPNHEGNPSTGSGYAYISGTSFSCPQISGVYALVFSMYGSISVDAAEDYIMNGAYNGPNGSSGSMSSSTWGAGFVQVDGALGL